jgi:hypothetical protein
VPDQRTNLKTVVQAISKLEDQPLGRQVIELLLDAYPSRVATRGKMEEVTEDETPDQQAAQKLVVKATGKRKKETSISQAILLHYTPF